MIAVPYVGYKNHLSTDRWHGLIHRWGVSHAASYDGDKLPHLLDKENTASSVWADTAYRSEKNQTYLEQNGFCSKIHFKKQNKKGSLWVKGRLWRTQQDQKCALVLNMSLDIKRMA